MWPGASASWLIGHIWVVGLTDPLETDFEWMAQISQFYENRSAERSIDPRSASKSKHLYRAEYSTIEGWSDIDLDKSRDSSQHNHRRL